jgi:hypothetical protein
MATLTCDGGRRRITAQGGIQMAQQSTAPRQVVTIFVAAALLLLALGPVLHEHEHHDCGICRAACQHATLDPSADWHHAVTPLDLVESELWAAPPTLLPAAHDVRGPPASS